MFTRGAKILALVVLSGMSPALWAQSTVSREHKVEIDSLAARLAKVHAGQVLMSKRADSLAQAITRLKAQPVSPLQTRALEAALRTSQTWADALQQAQTEELFLDQNLRQKAEQLLKNLSADLERLTASLGEAKRGNDTPGYNTAKQEVQTCRQWQKRCQEILASPATTILIYEVRAEASDDANTLARKADFLRDQADRLARESKHLEQKVGELRQQAALLTRMSEFDREVAMLENSNEGVANSGRETKASTEGSAISIHTRDQAGFSSTEVVVALSWPENVGSLSLAELTLWLKELQNTQKRLRVQADSLRARANDFETLRQQQQD